MVKNPAAFTVAVKDPWSRTQDKIIRVSRTMSAKRGTVFSNHNYILM